MRYLSVCSGIEAASAAWHDLDWTPLAFSEIEPFSRAVLAHRFPGVPLHGDFTVLRDQPWIVDADILVGGTPCQAFSVAGLRGSLSDARGNLTLEYVRLANAIDDLRRAAGRAPAWIVWENVPGVLSVADNAFGAFLGGLVGSDAAIEPPAGRGWTDAGVVSGPRRCAAWRVLDAQHFGLAQRRRRVFVLAREGAGDWSPADALLPVIESVRWHPAPRRETGQRPAPSLAARARGGGGLGTDTELDGWLIADVPAISPALKARDYKGPSSDGDGDGAPLIAHALRAEGFDASEDGTGRSTPLVPVAHTLQTQCGFATEDGTGRGSPLVPVPAHAFDARQSDVVQYGDRAGPLDTCGFSQAVAFQPRIARNGRGAMGDLVNALQAQSGQTGKGDAAPCVATAFEENFNAVREVDVAPAMTTRSVHTDQGYRVSQNAGGFGLRTTMQVRRLTPTECERLQGFPDDWTLIPWRGKPADECPDGPRYKALGNSMAVPVMRWIGKRLSLTAPTGARF